MANRAANGRPYEKRGRQGAAPYRYALQIPKRGQFLRVAASHFACVNPANSFLIEFFK